MLYQLLFHVMPFNWIFTRTHEKFCHSDPIFNLVNFIIVLEVIDFTFHFEGLDIKLNDKTWRGNSVSGVGFQGRFCINLAPQCKVYTKRNLRVEAKTRLVNLQIKYNQVPRCDYLPTPPTFKLTPTKSGIQDKFDDSCFWVIVKLYMI